MKTYRVTWEIDIDADDPTDAAVQAFNLMQSPTTATVFDVFDENGEAVRVDLMEAA